jgi:hypothetical protein
MVSVAVCLGGAWASRTRSMVVDWRAGGLAGYSGIACRGRGGIGHKTCVSGSLCCACTCRLCFSTLRVLSLSGWGPISSHASAEPRQIPRKLPPSMSCSKSKTCLISPLLSLSPGPSPSTPSHLTGAFVARLSFLPAARCDSASNQGQRSI